jgi:hypothetical protein
MRTARSRRTRGRRHSALPRSTCRILKEPNGGRRLKPSWTAAQRQPQRGGAAGRRPATTLDRRTPNGSACSNSRRHPAGRPGPTTRCQTGSDSGRRTRPPGRHAHPAAARQGLGDRHRRASAKLAGQPGEVLLAAGKGRVASERDVPNRWKRGRKSWPLCVWGDSPRPAPGNAGLAARAVRRGSGRLVHRCHRPCRGMWRLTPAQPRTAPIAQSAENGHHPDQSVQLQRCQAAGSTCKQTSDCMSVEVHDQLRKRRLSGADRTENT